MTVHSELDTDHCFSALYSLDVKCFSTNIKACAGSICRSVFGEFHHDHDNMIDESFLWACFFGPIVFIILRFIILRSQMKGSTIIITFI